MQTESDFAWSFSREPLIKLLHAPGLQFGPAFEDMPRTVETEGESG